jgi:hypothetical protein
VKAGFSKPELKQFQIPDFFVGIKIHVAQQFVCEHQPELIDEQFLAAVYVDEGA